SHRKCCSCLTGSPGRVLSTYKTSDVQNTTALLLSPDAATLFVGVKNAVLSLDVNCILQYDWTPKHGFRCQTSEKNCANFVRILQFINSTHLYACGNKFSYLLMSWCNFHSSAKGVCPYKGSERNTAVFVGEDGELYTTTTEDYFGSTPVISRHFSKGRNNLNLDTTFKKLSDPTFISSSYIPSEGKVLFFFREEAAEYSYTERFFVSRVAQVCTDDNGGERVLQKSWTTFAKSQLICQTEKQLPFNLLQDIVMMPPADDELPDNTRFYGIFTSQWSTHRSSPTAVCAFTLGSIKAAFSGAYKTYTAETYQREQPNPNSKLGKCGIHNDTDSTLNLVKKTFLTATSVKSEGNKQLLITNEVLYSRITAQTVQAASGHIYTVLYLLTETGLLHKVVLQNNGFHIIEEIQVFKQPQTVKSILLSVTKGVVFVGSSEGVIRVPVSNCSFYSSCAECVLARDPFCGWDLLGKACIPVSDMKPDLSSALVRSKYARPDLLSVVSVQLYRLVMLPCYSSSRQAKVSWRFPNHSTLPQSLYLQHEDGSLIFFVTPSTALEYFCVTEEQGFQQTAAISLKLQTSSRSQTSSSCSGLEPIPVPDLYEDTIMHQKIYYNELVAVSSLLAICLFVIAVGALLWWRKSHNTDPADPECLPAHDVGLSLHLK
uniref:Sema domain-containing protein n=1 Tax=Pygocentrus nattereri TaxID=42514 RepID=A0A3B4BS05_PYGNA